MVYYNSNARYGWVCPHCKTVLSPYNAFCFCENNSKQENKTKTISIKEMLEFYKDTSKTGFVSRLCESLDRANIKSVDDLKGLTSNKLMSTPGISRKGTALVIYAAKLQGIDITVNTNSCGLDSDLESLREKYTSYLFE